ncbi:MAG TPA: zf-HC2 domain-containing protein, partial [Kofleriaceae bacterium]|nr:zf-HC2 domain-containing protein [Kofleriaceae bacterium]
MTSRANCLSDSAFTGLLDHRLSAEQRMEVEVHVDACTSCRRLLLELSASLPSGSTSADVHTTHPARSSSDATALDRGSVVGRFVILDLLGVGGMGVV